MSQSLPPACVDCQKLLALGPDAFGPDVQHHLANCATCSHLYAQYCQIDTLLNTLPDVKPLPNLALRFQQMPQARRIADLSGDPAEWEGIVEERPETRLSHSWWDELATHSFYDNQGKKTMQKPSLNPDTESSDALQHGQFQQSVKPAPRPRRLSWRALVSVAVLVLAVLATVFAWLLPQLSQRNATGGHREATPTPSLVEATATATPIPTRAPISGLTEQHEFTASDSGRTVKYGITYRFALILDERVYPKKHLQFVCDPYGGIGYISNTPYAAPPLYAVRYEAIKAGSCTLQNGDFTLTVIVVDQEATATATPTPARTPISGLTEQYEFTASDNGRTVKFGITTRFTLKLDEHVYQRQYLQVVCKPYGAIGLVSNTPYAAPPLYAVRYQANKAGSCTIQNQDFTLRVIIEG